jgi:hypothetical protein
MRVNRRLLLTAGRGLVPLAVSCCLGGAAPAEAKDLLDWVIEAVDPTLAPARPLIECLAGGGNAEDCATEVAKTQGQAALPIGPEDDRVKKVVAVFEAARDERWDDVVNVGGEVVAKTVSCAVLPVQGPAKAPACSVIGWVLAKNAGLLDKTYQALKGPDWWALVDILGTGVCEFIPGDGAAGAAKDVLCGALADVLLGAKKMADQVAKGFVAGADALENAIFGDDSHMPYDTYYALYWQPWYHYATTLAFEGKHTGPLLGKIWNPCVDYFDSHNQYRSTARKTCDDMRDKRFTPEIRAFAAALPVAVDGYFETVARPAIWAAVMASYGKPSSKDLPGQKFFEQNCAFQMRMRFPFPEPDDRRCRLLEDQGRKFAMFASVYQQLASNCYADVKQQDVQPTLWARACEGMAPHYAQAFAGESLRLIGILGRLKPKGCLAPGKEAAKTGLVLSCNSHLGYSACLDEFGRNGRKRCRLDVKLVRASVPDRLRPATRKAATASGVVPSGVTPSAAAPSNLAPTFGRSAVAPLPSAVDLEAEALLDRGRVRTDGGRAVVQGMAGFGGGWSGAAQLFWTGGRAGSTLDLVVDVPQAGTWSVVLFLTRAPDYARLQVDVDGKPGARFEGYAPRVTGPVEWRAGTFTLEPGPRRVRLTIAGKSPASTGLLAGIDRVRLQRAGTP